MSQIDKDNQTPSVTTCDILAQSQSNRKVKDCLKYVNDHITITALLKTPFEPMVVILCHKSSPKVMTAISYNSSITIKGKHNTKKFLNKLNWKSVELPINLYEFKDNPKYKHITFYNENDLDSSAGNQFFKKLKNKIKTKIRNCFENELSKINESTLSVEHYTVSH